MIATSRSFTQMPWLNQAVMAIFSFLASQCVLAFVLRYFLDTDYFWPDNWLRWDSGHYLAIAENGYEMYPCADVPGFSPDSKDTCGNAGWFPGYPFLIRALTYVTGNYVLTAGILSKLFLLVSLFLTVKLGGFDRISGRGMLFSLVAAFSFGFVYYSAIFPMSAVVCFALCAYYFVTRDKLWLTALFCFLATVFYPVGCLVAGAFALYFLWTKVPILQRIIQSVVVALSGIAGLAFVFLILQITVDDWHGFFLVQDKYAHGYQNPRKTIDFFICSFPSQLTWPAATHYQTLFTFVMYVLACFFFIRRRMYKDGLHRWAFIYVSVFIWFSLCQAGDYSRFRSESLLLPFVFLLKDAPTRALTGITLLLLAVGTPIAYLFFTGVLI